MTTYTYPWFRLVALVAPMPRRLARRAGGELRPAACARPPAQSARRGPSRPRQWPEGSAVLPQGDGRPRLNRGTRSHQLSPDRSADAVSRPRAWSADHRSRGRQNLGHHRSRSLVLRDRCTEWRQVRAELPATECSHPADRVAGLTGWTTVFEAQYASEVLLATYRSTRWEDDCCLCTGLRLGCGP